MPERLDLIRPHLSRYTRRFSVLDFGAGINVPAIGTEIAKEFDCVVTCVEKDIVTPEFSPRIMWLKREFSATDLELMSECEHFDVVLGFNVCHWFGNAALKVADTLRRMGRYVFLQSPHGDDGKATETFGEPVRALDRLFKASGWNWKHLGDTVQFPGHTPRPVWMFDNAGSFRVRNTVLTRTCVSAHANSAETVITADHDAIRGRVNRKEWRDWIPGINLANFLHWNGIYPERETIIQRLREYPLPSARHGDITPHNFIIDGERLHLIDGGDTWGGDDRENLELTIRRIKDDYR